ncbi:hypothetical protein PHLCEN_2v11443 [Hermanssonia centrifuga]|uniref:DNA2/NAM7 helicase-like C-terminal domain-containing protein n=1 Tax=Hermanssonia centrifuga TaxID=98765 RepID=A0A2R6NKJ2_9APHY|nr:hypothetical protein PHLCEN_2v11443 [Hermanssonia centrifuga]
MPIPLGNFISDEVYNKKLKSVHNIDNISCISFVDVDKGVEEHCGKSWINMEEVHTVVNLVRHYYRHKPFVIITPYDAQRSAIQKQLEKENLPSHEKEFVIVSTVRTSKPGFLSSVSRNNVMLSRPTIGMVIVTNKSFLEYSGWDTLIGKLAERWASLAGGSGYVWTNWRRIADQTAHMPSVDAPKPRHQFPAAAQPANHSSATAPGHLHDLRIAMHDLRLTGAAAPVPVKRPPSASVNHDSPGLGVPAWRSNPKLQGSWRRGSDAIKFL